LGTLGGLFATIFDVDYNSIGVGFSLTASGASVAVYATAAGSVQPLPMLQGVVELSGDLLAHWIGCSAHAINNVPQAVGSCWTSAPNAPSVLEHAVLWQRDGSVTDLNAQIDPRAGWLLRYARGLNTAGQIVGQGYLNGQAHGFLLIPIPGSQQVVAVDEKTSGQAHGFLLTPISVSQQQMVAVDEKTSWKDMPEHIRARLPARLFNR
jgi:hypothetical protein